MSLIAIYTPFLIEESLVLSLLLQVCVVACSSQVQAFCDIVPPDVFFCNHTDEAVPVFI